MGTDFIQKATDSFERKQRRCLDSFDEPNLFSGAPKIEVGVVGVPYEGHEFNTDDEYRLSLVEDDLLIIRGVTAVGRVEDPPPSVVETMRHISPSAYGRVVTVFALTGKAEIIVE